MRQFSRPVAKRMSKRRISKEAGFVNLSKMPRAKNGNLLCRWCNKDTGSRRKTFCSPACIHEHKLRSSPSYVRECVFERDNGICAECHVDTKTIAFAATVLKHRFAFMQTIRPNKDIKAEDVKALIKYCLGTELGSRRANSYWDADHIVPVCKGGGECGLEGYRTLCIPCHKKVTAELRKRK